MKDECIETFQGEAISFSGVTILLSEIAGYSIESSTQFTVLTKGGLRLQAPDHSADSFVKVWRKWLQQNKF